MQISILDMGRTKKRNVRESIISILSREYPLSIRKIYNLVKKEYKLEVTYQAVFKLVKEMLEDCILENCESKMEYQLNIGWINQLEDELNIIKNNYNPKKEKSVPQMQERINEFVFNIGPKLKEYLGNDSCCIVTLSGTGQYYALNLWKYLQREGKDIKFVEVNKMDLTTGKKIKLNPLDFSNRKILIVDYGVFSGSIYKLLMDKLKPLKNKFKMKDIKFVVDIDLIGLADFSITSSVENLNTNPV